MIRAAWPETCVHELLSGLFSSELPRSALYAALTSAIDPALTCWGGEGGGGGGAEGVCSLICLEWASAQLMQARHDIFVDVQSYGKDLSQLGKIDGLNSGLYSLFTATFIGIGFGFLFFPGPTKAGMFENTASLGAEDQLLWQLLGGTIATVVGPICYTQFVSSLVADASAPPLPSCKCMPALKLQGAHVSGCSQPGD